MGGPGRVKEKMTADLISGDDGGLQSSRRVFI